MIFFLSVNATIDCVYKSKELQERGDMGIDTANEHARRERQRLILFHQHERAEQMQQRARAREIWQQIQVLDQEIAMCSLAHIAWLRAENRADRSRIDGIFRRTGIPNHYQSDLWRACIANRQARIDKIKLDARRICRRCHGSGVREICEAMDIPGITQRIEVACSCRPVVTIEQTEIAMGAPF